MVTIIIIDHFLYLQLSFLSFQVLIINYCACAMHAAACVKMASSKIILVKKPKAVSVVWNYFGLRADSNGQVLVEESDLPVCKECYKDVPAKSGNTSNLLVHLRDHHPMKYAEAYPKIAKGMKGRSKVDSRSQPTLEQTYERTTKYSSQSPIYGNRVELCCHALRS